MRSNNILAMLLAVLGITLMAAGLPAAAPADQPVKAENASEFSTQDLALDAEALETLPEPTDLNNYQQCWQSYIQCNQDCQFYSEPTRSQCVAWCYQTHWCAQV